jgi:hypothetical protein
MSLEVHDHCVISGPRARKSWLNKFSHSHAGGGEDESPVATNGSDAP